MTKTKKELAKEVSIVSKIPQKEVSLIIDILLDTISKTIETGNRIELRKFGIFSIKYRKPKIARNPKTGETVKVSGKKVCLFRPSNFMNDRIDNSNLKQRTLLQEE